MSDKPNIGIEMVNDGPDTNTDIIFETDDMGIIQSQDEDGNVVFSGEKFRSSLERGTFKILATGKATMAEDGMHKNQAPTGLLYDHWSMRNARVVGADLFTRWMQCNCVDYDVLDCVEVTKAMNQMGVKDHRPEITEGISTHVRWAQLGMPGFVLTHGLVDSFVLTDVRSVLKRDVQAPFAPLMISLPPEIGLEFEDPHRGGTFPVQFMSGHRWKVFKSDEAIAKFREGMRKVYSRWEVEKVRDQISEDCLAEIKGVEAEARENMRWQWSFRGYHDTGYSCCLRTHDLGGNETVGTWIRQASSRDGLLKHPHEDEMSNRDMRCMKKILGIFINLCLYLEMHPEEFRPKLTRKRRPTTKRKMSQALRPKTFTIGKNVHLPKPLRALARASSRQKNLWKAEARFVVRGHWRHMAMGPRSVPLAKRPRKRLWIRPFFKGPKDGPLIIRDFEVE